MKILQVTNIISPHQLPLAKEFVKILGADNFKFAAIRKPMNERLKLGWSNDEDEAWIIRPGENLEHVNIFNEWWEEADIVLCGERLISKIKQRILKKKITFYMSERWWKPPFGLFRLLHPGFLKMALNFSKLSSSPFFHYLPMGGYAAGDIKKITSFNERIWEWGYFTSESSRDHYSNSEKTQFNILWAGRMLKWKRVDTLIKAFAIISNKYSDAKLTIIGDGPESQKLKKMANKTLREGSYIFLSSLPIDNIRKLMHQHMVYVLTSNGYEGWGAVINEAMFECCVVVASQEAGAARSIIKHDHNGYVFKSGNWKDLSKILILLRSNMNTIEKIANEGHKTIIDLWSPKIAAERFVALSNSLLTNSPIIQYLDGPLKNIKS